MKCPLKRRVLFIFYFIFLSLNEGPTRRGKGSRSEGKGQRLAAEERRDFFSKKNASHYCRVLEGFIPPFLAKNSPCPFTSCQRRHASSFLVFWTMRSKAKKVQTHNTTTTKRAGSEGSFSQRNLLSKKVKNYGPKEAHQRGGALFHFGKKGGLRRRNQNQKPKPE